MVGTCVWGLRWSLRGKGRGYGCVPVGGRCFANREDGKWGGRGGGDAGFAGGGGATVRTACGVGVGDWLLKLAKRSI